MNRHAPRIAILIAVAGALYVFSPPDLPLCGFHWLTGRPCPLCGLTRAMFALAKGHWREALGLHALSPLAALILAGMIWNRPAWANWWLPCGAAFVLYGALRIFTA
jgi:hypothetical protein